MKQKSERRESGAVMYKSKTKSGEPMLNLIIKAQHCPEPDEQGNIRLTGFVNSYKTKKEHPDVLFYVARPRPQNQPRLAKQKSAPSSNEEAGGDDWF